MSRSIQRLFRKSPILGVVAAALFFGGKYFLKRRTAPPPTATARSATKSEAPKLSRRAESGGDSIRDFFQHKISGRAVSGKGRVVHLLPDDLDGSRHQRFLVKIPSGITLKFAHNIDLAPRVPLRKGDELSFRGQYEWNEKGGVVHWTHHDPAGKHTGGWIRHNNRLFK